MHDSHDPNAWNGPTRNTRDSRGAQIPEGVPSDGDAGTPGTPGAPEELSFGTAVRMRRRMPLWMRTMFVILALGLIAGLAAGFSWMWDDHWRPINVTVNNQVVRTRVDTTLDILLKKNDDFGAKRGRLLAIDGSVLDEHGGKAVVPAIGGQAIPESDWSKMVVPDHADVTVDSGADVTEAHTVIKRAEPYGADVDLRGGAIQMRLRHGKDGVAETWVGKKSGKKVDKGVTKKPEDMIVRSYSPRPEGKKVIALTFDDGPSKYSAPMLDILKSKGVKATFFDLGQQSKEFASAEKRMVAEGHEVASHSYDHPNMPKLNRDALRDNITKGFEATKEASGVDTKVLRSPYGAFGVQQWKDAGDLIDMNVLWDIDTLDWKRPGADAIHDNIMQHAHNGAIVLMHDGGGDRTQDIEALPRIIDDLRAQGYEFVTVKQLIEMSPKLELKN
ncbi:polysaccharide deacetylase family protein [Bifidobacterium callitrichos]|uniref:Polysaccharide deacetylase n=1 Tax=Bifidobacterium callitrichos DSM 23973 TaxID=1437609 RepID=A0A087A2Y4_9BIFI|nr:polysaccharide deacetylase family protein [Bifidobacterium callitrichos]KFI53134.1 polysaccharide deacetylase [Bifidobacterium callitrichos DSM 23973]